MGLHLCPEVFRLFEGTISKATDNRRTYLELNKRFQRDDTWRIKTNDELDKLIRHKNIINYIKAQRLSWFDHIIECQKREW
jgi:hypothetical protein